MGDDDPEDETTDQPAEPQQPAGENVASPKGVRKRKLTAQFLQRQADEFWRDVLSSEVGRREIWRLLADAHTFEERFACGLNGFPQTEATWFHAGEQAFGLRLYLTLSQRARDQILRMHDEHDPRFVTKKQ